MAATREIVTDQREQFAFHDDIAYLKETKRGLTRATVEEISAFKEEPDWMPSFSKVALICSGTSSHDFSSRSDGLR